MDGIVVVAKKTKRYVLVVTLFVKPAWKAREGRQGENRRTNANGGYVPESYGESETAPPAPKPQPLPSPPRPPIPSPPSRPRGGFVCKSDNNRSDLKIHNPITRLFQSSSTVCPTRICLVGYGEKRKKK